MIITAESQPPAKPSVFVMRNGTNVACLVKDFYPKNININLQSSKKIIEYDPAIVISPSGKYNAVKLGQYGDSNSVKCSVQHNNEIVYSTETEQTTNSPGRSYLASLGPGMWGRSVGEREAGDAKQTLNGCLNITSCWKQDISPMIACLWLETELSAFLSWNLR